MSDDPGEDDRPFLSRPLVNSFRVLKQSLSLYLTYCSITVFLLQVSLMTRQSNHITSIMTRGNHLFYLLEHTIMSNQMSIHTWKPKKLFFSCLKFRFDRNYRGEKRKALKSVPRKGWIASHNEAIVWRLLCLLHLGGKSSHLTGLRSHNNRGESSKKVVVETESKKIYVGIFLWKWTGDKSSALRVRWRRGKRARK